MTLLDQDRLRARFLTEGPQIARVVVAALVSWLVCRWIDPGDPPVYAVIVPLVAMRDHPFSAFNVSFDRLLGVVGGVVLGVCLVTLLGPTALALALTLSVGLLLGVVLRLGETLNIQVAVSGLLVFANTEPGQYAYVRLWETAVGAAVTVGLSPLLFPPDPVTVYRRRFQAVSHDLHDLVGELAVLAPKAPDEAQSLRRLRAAAVVVESRAGALPEALMSAERAVRFNPLRRNQIGALGPLGDPTRTLVSLSRSARTLLDEITDLLGRPDVVTSCGTTGRWLARALHPVADVLEAGLVADDSAGERSERIAAAGRALEEWRAEDPRPISAVLRRPVVHLLRLLSDHPRNDPSA